MILRNRGGYESLLLGVLNMELKKLWSYRTNGLDFHIELKIYCPCANFQKITHGIGKYKQGGKINGYSIENFFQSMQM